MNSTNEKQLAEFKVQEPSSSSSACSCGNEVVNPEPASPRTPETHSSNSLRNEVRVWTRDLLIAIGLALVIIVFLYQPVKVEGTSMAPLLSDQERIFINKFVYRFSAIERGDVVVFHYPRDPEKSYIKRVIALPGDRLRIDRGQVWLNGKLVREPYVPEAYEDSKSMREIVVPESSYFVMGDHRSI